MKFAFITIVWFFMSSCAGFATPYERCIHQIYKTTLKSLADETDLNVSGHGGGGDGTGKLAHLGLSFKVTRPLTEDEARILILKLARTLRDSINSHPCSREYFSEFPVNEHEVMIELYISDKSGRDFLIPYLSFVFFRGNEINYYGTTIDGDSYEYDYEHTETLEEALQKLGESQF